MSVFIYVWVLFCKWWAANVRDEHGLAGWEELLVWAGIKLILFPAQHRGPFCFSPTSEETWCTRTGRRHSQDSNSSWPQGISVSLCSACEAQGRRRRKGELLEGRCLCAQVTVTRDGALLSSGGLSTCLPMGVMNEFLVLLCLNVLLYLLYCLYLTPQIQFYSSDSLPHLRGAVSEGLCGAELLTGVKPWLRASQMVAGQGRTTWVSILCGTELYPALLRLKTQQMNFGSVLALLVLRGFLNGTLQAYKNRKGACK